ncbi:hypothetical protein AV521_21055 [Streptomyces sp. IMTB 2501]|uniref:hypothetical protein n=1 Tax=Streptomyces sp. IMTB 2501 TaxID=1776340 RepID=UPI00096EF3C9|nr:hypothetical protein [Streptomyces sp. IMTB 2501]OLZ68660.1 hypothetical protein AV521_21055 [Streptomyces sp. IMTB 2501]
MRPLSVPVRLTVSVLALAAAAGCVNVGDDAVPARPSHSAGRHGGEAPDGGPVDGARGFGEHGRAGEDNKHEHGGKAKPGTSPSASDTPSGEDSVPAAPAKPGKPGRTVKPGDPAPTEAPPTPPATSAPPEPPPSTPPPATSEPPTAEPSSSAHAETGPQLVQREPAPAAGAPA